MKLRIIRGIAVLIFIGLGAQAHADVSGAIYDYLPEQQSSALRNAVENGAGIGTYDKAFLAWTAYLLVQPNCGVADSESQARRMTRTIETALLSANFEDTFAQLQAQADFKKVWTATACNRQDGADLLETIVEVLETENNR